MDITEDESENERPPRTRKRKQYLSKKEHLKRKRNSGNAYTTLKGKKVYENNSNNMKNALKIHLKASGILVNLVAKMIFCVV
ncbi:hypothetical protein PR048_021136 [Dryococelus australis]|uniref:Uncharacterized protein n=1 Tax=Dryococelus australis TaxID=614101 RepID=A0ABQ9GXG3_9NEOP|nr:hypothetical protein PR048_021136 [Dryococelus australis]